MPATPQKRRLRITPSIVISVFALIVALSSSATAALVVSGKNIQKNAVASKHIKPKAVKGKHLAPGIKKKLNGAAGPQGPQGTTGLTGYQVVKGATKSVNANSWNSDVVWCPSGKRAISGGVSANSIHAQITSNQPVIHDDADPGPGYAPADEVADGWQGGARHNQPSTTTMTVYVVCANIN